jgi:hypothetical protein
MGRVYEHRDNFRWLDACEEDDFIASKQRTYPSAPPRTTPQEHTTELDHYRRQVVIRGRLSGIDADDDIRQPGSRVRLMIRRASPALPVRRVTALPLRVTKESLPLEDAQHARTPLRAVSQHERIFFFFTTRVLSEAFQNSMADDFSCEPAQSNILH